MRGGVRSIFRLPQARGREGKSMRRRFWRLTGNDLQHPQIDIAILRSAPDTGGLVANPPSFGSDCRRCRARGSLTEPYQPLGRTRVNGPCFLAAAILNYHVEVRDQANVFSCIVSLRELWITHWVDSTRKKGIIRDYQLNF